MRSRMCNIAEIGEIGEVGETKGETNWATILQSSARLECLQHDTAVLLTEVVFNTNFL